MLRVGVAGGACLCLLLAQPRDVSAPPVLSLQGRSLIEHDSAVATPEPGPHDGGGQTTAYSFFARVPNLDLVFRKRALHKGAAIGYHRQDEDEIYYVLSGTGELTLNGDRSIVGPGTAILTRPGSSHGLRQLGANDLVTIIAYRQPSRVQSADSGASPEMRHLATAFAGDWSSVEVVQNGRPVPAGAGRRGTVHVRLAGGGTVLVSEGHTVGTVGGDLRWFINMWWDPEANRYGLLTCFRVPTGAGCELRGTVRWAGDTLVNDYDEMFEGKRTKMQDRWTDITPTSSTLTELHDTGNGVMIPYVVSHNTRQ